MKKRRVKFGLVGVVVALVAVLLTSVAPNSAVVTTGGGILSLQSRIAIAMNSSDSMMGTGEPLPQEIIESTFSRGGPPVTAINYNFEAVGNGIILHISCKGLPDIALKYSDIPKINLAIAEWAARRYVQRSFEVWIPVRDFPVDDPVRNKLNPILLDNERIENDYLVITLAYFDIHIYSLNPLRFTTRINGLDAGHPTGNWWE